MKIEIYRGKDRKHYVRLIGRNGRKLMQSEGCNRRAGAMNCFHVVAAAFEDGTWFWKDGGK